MAFRIRGFALGSLLAALALAGCVLGPLGSPPPSPAPPAAQPQTAATGTPTATLTALAPTLLPSSTPHPGPPQLEQSVWLASPQDGSLMVIDAADNSLAVIIPTGLHPDRVVLGEGSAWAIDPASSSLIQVDPQTFVIRQISSFPQYQLNALAAGHGAVWLGVTERSTPFVLKPFEEFTPIGGVLRIDPASGKTTGYAKSGPAIALTSGPDALWALLDGVPGTPLVRIDPSSLALKRFELSGTSDWLLEDAFLASPDGLWLYSAGFGRLYHTDLQGRLYAQATLGQHKPLGSAALLQAVGSLWLAAPWGSILRFDPASGQQNAEIDINQPFDLLLEGGGAVWVVSSQAGSAFRIDPQSNQVVARVSLGTALKPTPRVTPTAVRRATRPCEDGPYSRLAVGMRATTPLVPAVPNRLHKEPGMESELSGYIQPGQHVQILSGPDCTDYWNWWQVKVEETGASGWAAEGNETEYWLIPLQ